jgi:hypothetical protein
MRWRNDDTVPGSVDLDDVVQVAHVEAQLQRAGGHDHAVRALSERRLCGGPLRER